MSNSFQGILRASTTASGVSIVGLRGRYNERREFLITTIQPAPETASPGGVPVSFPQIATGSGYATQFVLMNASGSFTISSTLQFFSQSGANLNLSLR